MTAWKTKKTRRCSAAVSGAPAPQLYCAESRWDTREALPAASPRCGHDSDLAMIFAAVWWDHGIAAIAEQTALFFPVYKKAGGQLNELVADWEATMWKPSGLFRKLGHFRSQMVRKRGEGEHIDRYKRMGLRP